MRKNGRDAPFVSQIYNFTLTNTALLQTDIPTVSVMYALKMLYCQEWRHVWTQAVLSAFQTMPRNIRGR